MGPVLIWWLSTAWRYDLFLCLILMWVDLLDFRECSGFSPLSKTYILNPRLNWEYLQSAKLRPCYSSVIPSLKVSCCINWCGMKLLQFAIDQPFFYNLNKAVLHFRNTQLCNYMHRRAIRYAWHGTGTGINHNITTLSDMHIKHRWLYQYRT